LTDAVLRSLDVQKIGATSSQTSSSNPAIENAVAQHVGGNAARAATSSVFENLRPRADRTEGESGSQIAQPAIGRARLPLAGYLYARASIRRTIDAQDAASLIDAQDTLTETRAILGKGRGNVIDDNLKTNFVAVGRSQAALVGQRALQSVLQSRSNDPAGVRLSNTLPQEEITGLTGDAPGRVAAMGSYMALAAGSIVNESGYCDAHAYVSLVQHAPKVGAREMLTIVGAYSPFPHTWANVERRRGAGQQVILDSWAEGPAILAEDSRRQGPHVASNSPPTQDGSPYQPVVIGDVTLDLALTQASARLFASGVGKMANAMQNDRRIMRTFEDTARRMTSKWVRLASRPGVNFETIRGAYSPMSVLSHVFVQAVRDAQTRPGRATDQPASIMADVRAAGVARHFGLGIRAATRDTTIAEVKEASETLLASGWRPVR
jgi:hypothetical protein